MKVDWYRVKSKLGIKTSPRPRNRELSGSETSISLKPYVRVEQVVVPLGDDVFTPLALNYDGVVVGVRYDPGAFLALRLEYRYEQFEGLDTTNSLYAQASFVLAGS